MKNILNIAGYKFITLNKLESLRDQLKALCRRCELKGTILLAEEGINIMLAGSQANVAIFLNEIKNDSRFPDMEFKNSYSNFVPFQRLLIKIKKEIIAFNISGVHPEKYTAPRIYAQEFKQWLDKNKDMVVLDVRNQCEIEAGKFKNAIDLEIKNFKTFPQATKKLPESIKQKPIVAYCTGGIRCEKAATYLMRQGFKQVFQLQGGILQYFAECGATHFEGQCFVFDDRGKLTAKDAI